MSFVYLRTSIIKADSGKSAVASASYQLATKLYDETQIFFILKLLKII